MPKKLNMRTRDATQSHGKLMRELLTAQVVREKDGRLWLQWTWQPEPRPDGFPDCGHSGIADNVTGFLTMCRRFGVPPEGKQPEVSSRKSEVRKKSIP